MNFLCTFSGFIANYLGFDFVRERVEVNQCLKKNENTVKKKKKEKGKKENSISLKYEKSLKQYISSSIRA